MLGSPFTLVDGLKNPHFLRASVRGKNTTPVRTVVVPYTPEEPLLRALRDVRSGVNKLVPDWRAHSEESRFEATRRSYRELRPRFRHLAAHWTLAICNESSATLRTWDKTLRRARRHDPARFERMRRRLPHRQRLKVNLPRDLYRLHGKTLDITLRPDHHIHIDLSETRNPLFWGYLRASNGEFGLAVTDQKLVFQFRVPHEQPVVGRSAGIDINMPSADWASTDGLVDLVDLSAIPRVQGAMARKRERIQRAIRTDRKARGRVMRRYRGRERNRLMPLLHQAANELLEKVGDHNLVLEDLSSTTEDCIRRTRWNEDERRRRLSAWTHGQFTQILSYKARTAVVRVNPRGTSSTCPQCGGALHHPSWRRSDCDICQGSWHRDRAAAIAILDRGVGVLRGAAPPPSARNALLEAAAWRPGVDDESAPGPLAGPMNEDDAKDFGSV
ncbi:MAG: transposase [Thermoplasmata archaeon]|jgi:putative transposase